MLQFDFCAIALDIPVTTKRIGKNMFSTNVRIETCWFGDFHVRNTSMHEKEREKIKNIHYWI